MRQFQVPSTEYRVPGAKYQVGTGNLVRGTGYTACPLQFADVPQGSTFNPYIRCLACQGVASGYPDGSFKPDNEVTRGQLAKMVSNAAGLNDDPL